MTIFCSDREREAFGLTTFLVSFDREPEKNAPEIGLFLVRVPAFFGGVRVAASKVVVGRLPQPPLSPTVYHGTRSPTTAIKI